MVSDNPRVSMLLMQLTWILGGVGFWNGFDALKTGDLPEAIQSVAVWSVGGVGLVSFIRHAVFHRSDAVRMGWDLGQRNDFQIEVGFANLAWGIVALVAWVRGWGTLVLGSLVLMFGIYMLQAAVLHWLELRQSKRRRITSHLASSVFAVCLLWFGILVLS